MSPGLPQDHEHVNEVVAKANRYGLCPEVHAEHGAKYTAVEVYLKDGKTKASSLPEYLFENLPGVERVVRVSPSTVSAAMNGDRERLVIPIGPSAIGPNHPCLLVAGPCAIDKHAAATLEMLARHGVQHIRGGWRKPRSRAEAFRGFGADVLEKFMRIAQSNGMKSIWTEVIESPDVETVRRLRDRTHFTGDVVLWVGARNSGNYRLLEKLGEQNDFIVMLKHGLRMTRIDELMELAGWVLYGPMYWDEDGRLDVERSAPSGNQKLIFCVRGLDKVDQHDPHRFTPNFSWIDELHDRARPPVCLDPSHMAGRADLVLRDLAEGLTHNPDVALVECHAKPEEALCDKDQAIGPDQIEQLVALVDEHNRQRGYGQTEPRAEVA
ncbi:MAG: hypothetical protein RB292_01720 [Patescibacteria group bacterium]|nr:hypothetical protein [Patescibacteria group bacterium]